ncbi:hypothetical protein C499_02564 [Halogeometricum borinquense DSM 11551]|uniref:DUF7662 domain-containing protein n=1 Tax=Halogeometricum borinquense (strain ATCC 700274 / DSM 11551 / JCM 10706 / KCTC 4070 / PR3) TaxID=469382 RepID=E4NPX1_HALBP|nr:GIY-YIG nuclease family protein [Halogeometricum borinquense]ADQ66604.1 hypothetical protein Hbor_10100 [Halogeometricum borinquense DSM 11551]ELY30711.1 hypothetical protein C499_02564 [Halogeometricum borinquense DSM 11551]
MELCGYAFGRVCDIEPDRTERGVIDIHVPQSEYAKRDEKAVHDYGWGPFCSFGVPDDGTHCSGVYVIAVADEVVYVGETKDLYDQFTNGYGRISPANCFEGGQGTNCRLNTGIFHAVRAGDRVSIHLHATDDFEGTEAENRALRRIIKDDLITAIDPEWNKNTSDETNETADHPTAVSEPKADRPENAPDPTADCLEETPESTADRPGETPEPAADTFEFRETTRPDDAPTGEFSELYDYLTEHERDSVERTFAELEVVLDAPLPTEARRWQRWWTNDPLSHPHSKAWLRAGYKVADVSLPDGQVRFERLRDSSRASDTAETPQVGRVSPGRRE